MSSALFAFSCDLPYAKLDLKKESPDNAWLAASCATIEDVARNAAFDHLPFKLSEIRALAAKTQPLKTVADLSKALSVLKPGVLEEQLRPLVTWHEKPEDETAWKKWEEKNAGLMELAVAAYTNALFSKVFAPKEKGGRSVKEPVVKLVVNIPDWMLVKKAPSNPSGQEVAAALSGMYGTASRKLFTLGCANPNAFDALWAQVEAKHPERKSITRASAILADFAGADLSSSIKPYDEKAYRAAFCAKLLAHAGFAPFVTTASISAAFPEVKIPKPRGNYGGGKKKKKV